MKLEFQLLSDKAVLPERAYEDDAGLDLTATETALLGPGERAVVGTGLAVAIPPGHAGLVIPRSGLAAKHGISVVNAPGLIDSGYRGEIKVILLNTDRHTPFTVNIGDRIAQLVITPTLNTIPCSASVLTSSERAQQGFGSSGIGV